MIESEMPELLELVESLWPGSTRRLSSEYRKAVVAKLEPFFVAEVMDAFRAHRQSNLDAPKPMFDAVVASLANSRQGGKEWRDEEGRTDAQLVAHLSNRHKAGLQVLDEAGEEAVNEAWERVLGIAANEAKANKLCGPYRDRIYAEGPRKWPVTAARAVNPGRFDAIMAGDGTSGRID